MIFNIFNKKTVEIKAPISGKVIPLEEVKDKVFSEKILGNGIAIEPEEGIVVAPFDGKVSQIFPTGHAIVLETDKISLLIHIGIDTVDLEGKGFEIIAKENQKVKTGDELIKFDIDFIKEKGYIMQSPLVLPEKENIKSIEFTKTIEVMQGRDVIMKVHLK